MTPYYAAMTRRWHTNEHMSHTVDPVGYHGGRMAILALMFWPDCSKWLLVECVTHDLGEYKTGDIPWGAPNKDNEAEHSARCDMGMAFNVGIGDTYKMKFLDILDAYMWMQHHAPFLATRLDWIDQRKKIVDMAEELGVDLMAHGIDLWRF